MKLFLYAGVCLIVFYNLPVLAKNDIRQNMLLPSAHRHIGARLAYDEARHTLAEENSLTADYGAFKKALQEKWGLSYALTGSFLPQRATPNGKGTVWQSKYDGLARWDLMRSDTYGNLSAQISYSFVHYWGKSGQDISKRIGVVSPVNNNSSNGPTFDNLSVTYQLPERWWKTALTLGQYKMDEFDGTPYDSNEQITFINNALAQNASATYLGASLGAHLSIQPTTDWTIVVGLQDAYNVSGEVIHTKHLDKKKYTTFASVNYSPSISRWGNGQYGILLYYQPSIPARPDNSVGWSLNAMQNFGQIGVFARLSGSNSSIQSVKQSYVLGGIYNNPLNRNVLDQIGLAVVVNKLNRKNERTRAVENVFEAYWAWGISNFLTITPDVQFYLNPGENRKSHTATVASVRATVMF